MVSVVSKRSPMTLYSGPKDQYSHRVRMVLTEKEIEADVVSVDPVEKSEDVAEINPYCTLPTLRDRELGLYEVNVIMEYLDERFPYPPLLPVYPVARAQSRLLIYRLIHDWCKNADLLLTGKSGPKAMNKVRKELSEDLTQGARFFSASPFFLSDELTLVDCCVAPLLWRLPLLSLSIPSRQLSGIEAYAKRIFSRPAFQNSLSEEEKEMRKTPRKRG